MALRGIRVVAVKIASADARDHSNGRRGSRSLLTRHTAYYLVGRVATGAVGLLVLVVFTRVLSARDYGRYSVIIAIGGLITAVGFQWLRQCLVRFGIGELAARQPLLGTLGALFAGLSLALIVICAVLAGVVHSGAVHIGLLAAELGAVCCLVIAQAWFELAADASRTLFKPWRYSAATFSRSLLTLLLGVAAALLTHHVLMVVLAMAVAYFLASWISVPRWFTGLLHVELASWRETKHLVMYGLPLAGTLGMTYVLDSADRLMLAGMQGYTEAGVYSSAYNLAQFSIGTLLAGIGLGSLPLAVGVFKKTNRPATAELLGKNMILGLGIGTPAVIGLAMLAPGLDRILLGNYVAGRSEIVTMVVAVAIGCAAIRSYCVDVVFMLHQRTWMQALVVGLSALLNVLLNLLWIPRWGAVGAAAATLAAFVFAFIGSWWLSRRYLKIPLLCKDIAKIVASSGVMVAVLAALSPNAGHGLRLALGVVCGAGAYALVAVALDLAGSRARFVALLGRRGARG